MQDLIKTIVETEKEAEQTLREARSQASALLGKADAEAAEQIRLLRQEERDRTASVLEAAEKKAAERLLKAEAEAEKQFELVRSDPSGQVPGLADLVVARIISTVFDGGDE